MAGWSSLTQKQLRTLLRFESLGVGGDDNPNELYDEESGRWFKLPHAMVKPRHSTGLVSVPAAALALH